MNQPIEFEKKYSEKQNEELGSSSSIHMDVPGEMALLEHP
jgi:hypothetical protein